jgi:hypothetical protein
MLKEEYKVAVSENTVLGAMFAPRGDEVTGS